VCSLFLFIIFLYVLNIAYSLFQSLVAPLCVVEVTDILWLHLSKPQLKSSPDLLGTLLLLSGISTHKAALISGCIQMLVKAMQDTCIYFFTFITFHVILEWPKNIQLISSILDTYWLEGNFMHSYEWVFEFSFCYQMWCIIKCGHFFWNISFLWPWYLKFSTVVWSSVC